MDNIFHSTIEQIICIELMEPLYIATTVIAEMF